MEDTGANAREKLFAREWVINGHSAKGAATVAGYSDPKQGYKLLNNPRIKAEIDKLMEVHMRSYNITIERIIEEYAAVAFFDIGDVLDKHGNPLPIDEIKPHTRRALAGLDIERLFEGRGSDREQIGTINKFKTNPKMEALKELGKIINLVPDRTKNVKISGDLNHKVENEVSEADLKDRINQLIKDEIGDALE